MVAEHIPKRPKHSNIPIGVTYDLLADLPILWKNEFSLYRWRTSAKPAKLGWGRTVNLLEISARVVQFEVTGGLIQKVGESLQQQEGYAAHRMFWSADL
jgi:hypothetical protein